MKEFVLIMGALYGMLSVVFGAFGAHALKKKFTAEQLTSFETGVKYQMYHAILLVILGLTLPMVNSIEHFAAIFIIVGIFLFSFSIYGLCITSSNGKKLKILGPITPLGGLCLVIGWILLIVIFASYGFYL
ncbi:DUF423 domain-containing protein [Mesonia maritima]|uniref:Uncharacterized membrane protein YgdD (TMEM256/DUF423 family) n=1 Tax=Mesonia maritima TaxID=1793873 RepID=A0ABU1K6X4_9FLAO|nr:DUF423 domain-containing protein [Mesonia maritima]MDR6300762.1 uncharacterized membrane protein YgdD (TMEM256/DUF423 family) [Mesonia maritima]